MRLDLYLVEKGYFPTRSKASLAIKELQVSVNGRSVNKAGFEVNENDLINVKVKARTFVSRGGEKLQGALVGFNVSLKEKVVLDIGASTGGFTDCALQNGASKVYAYDVGHDQLDSSLRNNEKVIVKEGINCRNLKAADFNEPIDFICIDVSFISCGKMFEAITDILADGKEAIVLFKPQFEVGSAHLNRQGIVTSDRIIEEKLAETIQFAKTFLLQCQGQMISPIKGGDGNKEYLLYLKKGD